MRKRSTEWRKVRATMENTAHIVGEDYVNMVLSDMIDEEIYCGALESAPMIELPRVDSIELDWDGRYNKNDEMK